MEQRILNIEQIEKEREMKERPILFSGEMVRAILDDRKTMTRRVVKPQPEQDTDCPYHIGTGIERKARICPYGKPGDRLWVRETFCDRNNNGEQIKPLYRSDGQEYQDGDGRLFEPKWKPSIFMPRMYSRITLEITNVRVERLQKINNADALAEGTPGAWVENSEYLGGYEENENKAHVFFFRQLWDSINAKRGYSWESNPWVWVVEFERIKEQGRG
jgi:hypothetical protein